MGGLVRAVPTFKRSPTATVLAYRDADLRALCSVDSLNLLRQLKSSDKGLNESDIRDRRRSARLEVKGQSPWKSVLRIAIRQGRNPLVLVLIIAALASLVLADWIESLLVLTVIFISTAIGFTHEFVASRAFEKLAAKVRVQTTVVRSGRPRLITATDVVPGDVICLAAGDLVPADCILIQSDGLYVNQALITGESFPVRKYLSNQLSVEPLFKIPNCLLMGTSIESGSGRALVVRTGAQTQFGSVQHALETSAPPSEFERSLDAFGVFLTRTMVVIVLSVLLANLALGRPTLEMVMFAVALAVGLTPELLPAIVSVMLSRGARLFATKGVIVRKLNAIESLGSMTILCTDKTGTLTLGRSRLKEAQDQNGQPSRDVLKSAFINAHFQAGRANPIDQAIDDAGHRQGFDLTGVTRVAEIPLDFDRKRVSVIVRLCDGTKQLICKGGVRQVLACCNSVGAPSQPMSAAQLLKLTEQHHQLAAQGYRLLGVAIRAVDETTLTGDPQQESNLCFLGMLVFLDPLKTDAHDTVGQLHQRGVVLKIITGDDRQAAHHAAEWVGIPAAPVITGQQLEQTNDQALVHLVQTSHVFAEVDPSQKKRIVSALQQSGEVVGFLGDGVNDALALHAADVGISVENAVDVAREASDFILLRKELRLVCEGIDEGRKIFVNTMKYIFSTTSANFGNMISMGFVSLFIPFLPLLPVQVLLNNLLSDVPSATLATDRVDPPLITKPRRLHTGAIRSYMIYFGLISVVFDLLTFGVLLWVADVSDAEFRSAWFVESLLSELAVLLVIRTNLPLFKSNPSRWLMLTTLVIAVVACCLPYLSIGAAFGLVPIPASVLITMIAIALLYAASVQRMKAGHGLGKAD